MIRKLVATDHDAAITILRLALGVIFFAHGAQKMLGWFGGYGFTGTMGFFTGEDTLRERSSRRSFSNRLSDGRLGPSAPEDVTVDRAPGSPRCSECPETAHNRLVVWRILGR